MRSLITATAAAGLLAMAAGPGVAAAASSTLALGGRVVETSLATHRSNWSLTKNGRHVGTMSSRCNEQTLFCAVAFRLPHGSLLGDFKLVGGRRDRGAIKSGSGRYRDAKGWFGMAFGATARSMKLTIHLR
jgi:hypothetical protein